MRCLGGLRMKYLRLEAPAQARCGSVGRSRLSVLKETRRFTGAWQERFRLRGRRKDLFGDTRGYKSYDSNHRKCCMLLHILSLACKRFVSGPTAAPTPSIPPSNSVRHPRQGEGIVMIVRPHFLYVAVSRAPRQLVIFIVSANAVCLTRPEHHGRPKIHLAAKRCWACFSNPYLVVMDIPRMFRSDLNLAIIIIHRRRPCTIRCRCATKGLLH